MRNMVPDGCTVRILDCEFNEELEYKIVGSTEANSLKGKISNESPVGLSLIHIYNCPDRRRCFIFSVTCDLNSGQQDETGST